jgi:hypothetical protein
MSSLQQLDHSPYILSVCVYGIPTRLDVSILSFEPRRVGRGSTQQEPPDREEPDSYEDDKAAPEMQ